MGLYVGFCVGFTIGFGVECCMGFSVGFGMGLTYEEFRLSQVKTQDRKIPGKKMI